MLMTSSKPNSLAEASSPDTTPLTDRVSTGKFRGGHNLAHSSTTIYCEGAWELKLFQTLPSPRRKEGDSEVRMGYIKEQHPYHILPYKLKAENGLWSLTVFRHVQPTVHRPHTPRVTRLPQHKAIKPQTYWECYEVSSQHSFFYNLIVKFLNIDEKVIDITMSKAEHTHILYIYPLITNCATMGT